MKYFEQAQENLKRSNFYKALELFEISLKEDALSKELKIFCCEKIERINEILQKDSTQDLLTFLADNYFELGHFEKAQEFYGKLFYETKRPTFLKKQFLALLSDGNIAIAQELAKQYLDALLKSRLSDEIINFLNENERIFKEQDMALWRLRAAFLSGNIGQFEIEIKSWKELNENDQRELFQMAMDLTGHNAKYWHSSKLILESFWQALCQNDVPYLLSRKRVIKLVLDYWLIFNKNHDLIESSVQIAKKYKLPIIGHELSKFVGDSDLIDYFLNRMPRDAFTKDSYDLGADLFDEKDRDHIKKIERDIKFLIKSGNNAEALKLTYELEKQDPQNPIIQKVLGDRKAKGFTNNEKKIEDLLNEIDRYVPEREAEDDYESSFISVVKHYDTEFVGENYEDIIIGFNLINLPKVALEVVKKVIVEDLSERDLVNLKYLEIETLLKDEQFFSARDSVEDVLSHIPLIPEERLSMTYLRAEAYYCMNKWDYALKLFTDIFHKNPSYRLTSERIKVIERNK